MKKGSALFRVSKSFVREVCRKQGNRSDQYSAAADEYERRAGCKS